MLQSIPGLGERTISQLLAYIGRPERFKSVKVLIALAALTPLIAAFWAKLKAQNKPGKVIVVACMHKLLAIAYGVLRSGKPFGADYLHRSIA